VSGQGVTWCGQVSGNRFQWLPPWAEPLRPFCRNLDGHVRWSGVPVDTDRPVAALRTAGVCDPCRIAGRCPNPCHTMAIRNGGAAAEASGGGVRQPGGLTGARRHRR
jgi:hypothetical protein